MEQGVTAPTGEPAAASEDRLDAAAAQRDSDASWTAEPQRPSAPEHRAATQRQRRNRWLMWTASAGLGIAVAAGGWLGSERLFEEDATQRVADQWLAFRTCLLGPRLPAGTAPSQQARFVALAAEGQAQHADWPARCAPYAQALDEAMAAPSLGTQYAGAPRAASWLADGDLSARGDELNRLYDRLAAADLPIALNVPPVPAAPTALRPLLSKAQLAPLGRVETLASVAARADSSDGTSLRLLLPEQRPVLCSLNDGSARSQRWRSAACTPTNQPLDNTNGVSMARFAKGAPVLLRVQGEAAIDAQEAVNDAVHYKPSQDQPDAVSYYDATTGMRLWRTIETGAQAATTADGQALVLEISAAGDNGRRKRRPKLITLAPGKRPNRRSLRLKQHAQAVLSPGALVWWQSEADAAIAVDEVSAQPLGSKSKARATSLGRLPLHAELVADCAGAFGQALLTRNNTQPPRYTVLFHRDGSEATSADAGVSGAEVTMACHDRFVTVLREEAGGGVNLSRCTRTGCTELGSTQLRESWLGHVKAKDSAVSGRAHSVNPLRANGTLGEQLISAWSAPDQPVRLRIGNIGSFDETETLLLLDDPERSGIRAVALRILSGDGLALVLLQAADGQVYALRIDAQHQIKPISVAR